MAMEKIGDGLKKILLVGIGAAATTVEKSQQIIDELVKKGEITVEQGKELNKELQHNVKKTLDSRKLDAASVEEKLSKMGKDELEFLKKKIKEAEEAADKIKETATDVVEDVTGLTESDQAAAESAEKDAMDEDLAGLLTAHLGIPAEQARTMRELSEGRRTVLIEEAEDARIQEQRETQ